MSSALALGFYITAWILIIRSVHQRIAPKSLAVIGLLAAALVCHGVSAYQQIVVAEGYRFSFFKMASLFFWVINLLVLLSSLKKPLHTLFVLLLPLTLIAIIAGLPEIGPITPRGQITPGVALHIFLSLLAYSAMTMAAFQALLLAFQNYQLRHKHPTGWVRLLPPLQTMEALLFELLWAGEGLLTLAIVSGAIYIDNIFAQHLAHKTVFSLLAWLIYAILLWGRHKLGWRGNAAIRWTLGGFASLMLAYFGSKLVLEFILAGG